jgi:hypothetical protein
MDVPVKAAELKHESALKVQREATKVSADIAAKKLANARECAEAFLELQKEQVGLQRGRMKFQR